MSMNWTAALFTYHQNQLRIIMLLLAEVTITLSMGLWNSIMHWAALCEDSNVNLVSLILSTTDTHLLLFHIHASNPVNFLINPGYCNAALLNAVQCELLCLVLGW